MEAGIGMAAGRSSLTDVKEIVRLSNLYDFYGPLLKDRHREIFEAYVLDDLSLGEIAGQYGMTRQGVYDIVKRCSRHLEEYEEKLSLFDRFQKAKERLGQVERLVRNEGVPGSDSILDLTHEIYEML